MKYLFVVLEYGYPILKRGSKLREPVFVYLATLLSLLTRTTWNTELLIRNFTQEHLNLCCSRTGENHSWTKFLLWVEKVLVTQLRPGSPNWPCSCPGCIGNEALHEIHSYLTSEDLLHHLPQLELEIAWLTRTNWRRPVCRQWQRQSAATEERLQGDLGDGVVEEEEDMRSGDDNDWRMIRWGRHLL